MLGYILLRGTDNVFSRSVSQSCCNDHCVAPCCSNAFPWMTVLRYTLWRSSSLLLWFLPAYARHHTWIYRPWFFHPPFARMLLLCLELLTPVSTSIWKGTRSWKFPTVSIVLLNSDSHSVWRWMSSNNPAGEDDAVLLLIYPCCFFSIFMHGESSALDPVHTAVFYSENLRCTTDFKQLPPPSPSIQHIFHPGVFPSVSFCFLQSLRFVLTWSALVEGLTHFPFLRKMESNLTYKDYSRFTVYPSFLRSAAFIPFQTLLLCPKRMARKKRGQRSSWLSVTLKELLLA